MFNYKNFGENPIYNLMNYIYYFFGVGISFILTNILFILALIVFPIRFEYLIIFTIALIPTGPSLTALFSVMGKLVREKDIYPFKDFFKGYKLNFKETMKIWIIQLLLLFILVIDFNYIIIAKNSSSILLVPLLIISALLVCSSIYLYAILSRFELRVKDLIKLSIFYTFKRLPLSLLNMVLLISLNYFALFRMPVLLPFVSGIIVFLLMLGLSSVLTEIEENIVIKPQETEISK